MKKRTLSETWRLCLEMWKWIDEEIEAKGLNYWKHIDLKQRWLKKHRIRGNIRFNCFFCHYAFEHAQEKDPCLACPGKLVNKSFHCGNRRYDWCTNPYAFYKKLVSLNKTRLKKESIK